MATLALTHNLRNPYAPTLSALALGLLALGVLFHAEAAAAVQVWIDSTAYGHCFLVLPMALYLAWDRRASLVGVPVRPMPAAALLAGPAAAAWFVAERLGIMEGRQLVAMGVVQVLFLAVLGWRLCWALAAPLLYLFFLVPFGAFLTGPLQDFTAWFIDVGLDVLGIPHIVTDYLIEIPQGVFYVAEACAGLRFLIAAVGGLVDDAALRNLPHRLVQVLDVLRNALDVLHRAVGRDDFLLHRVVPQAQGHQVFQQVLVHHHELA